MKDLADALSRLGVECKLVNEFDYSSGFPSKKISEWFFTNKKFKKLIEEFKPDAVFVDRQLHFGVDTINAKIPLFIFLRGHYWLEKDWAKKTIYKSPLMRAVIWFRSRKAHKCFRDATAILTPSKFLEKIVNEYYPNKPTYVLLEGIDSSLWYSQEGMNFKHPCVGLLQNSYWWGKAKEMMILPKILEAMPDVTFYWAGGGTYQEKVLLALEKYSNFKFMGRIQYPEQVRQFLTEIDVYALITGMDTMPATIREAVLMKKPVIATNVGSIPEAIENGKTGYTINEGDVNGWIEKLTILLNDKKNSNQMSLAGYEFTKNKFTWDKTAKNLLTIIKKHLNKV